MELAKIEKFKIGDSYFYAKITNRAIIEFENLSGKKFTERSTTEDNMKFFFCCAKAGFKSAGVEFNYSFDQFLDLEESFPFETMTRFMEVLFKPEENVDSDLPKKK